MVVNVEWMDGCNIGVVLDGCLVTVSSGCWPAGGRWGMGGCWDPTGSHTDTPLIKARWWEWKGDLPVFFNRFWQIDIYFDASTNDFIPWQFESCLMFFLSLVWNISLFEAHSMCFCSSMLYCSPPYDDDVVIGVPPPPHLIKITCSWEGDERTKCNAGGTDHIFHCIESPPLQYFPLWNSPNSSQVWSHEQPGSSSSSPPWPGRRRRCTPLSCRALRGTWSWTDARCFRGLVGAISGTLVLSSSDQENW